MRLAQIARKVGMTPQDVRRFLEKEFELNIGNEPNYKLDDAQVEAVLNEFPLPEVEEIITSTKETLVKTEEIVEAPVEEESPTINATEELPLPPPLEETNEEISERDSALEEEQEAVSETLSDLTNEESQEVTSSKAPIVEIDYEREAVEDAENSTVEPAEVDPNAALIKAPTIKLDGLKILGKIELPETKKVEETEENEISETDVIAELDAAMQSQVQDVKPTDKKEPLANKKSKPNNENFDESEAYSIYKDKRGNYRFTLEQKANRLKSIAESNERKKLEAEKEKKRRHYEKIAEQRKEAAQAQASKKEKSKKHAVREQKRQAQQKPKPTSLWGKFVHWLND